MPLTLETIAEVLAACRQNSQEAADALSRSLDSKLQLIVPEGDPPPPCSLDACPAEWNEAGLIVVLKVDGGAALAILSEKSGLLPAWCPAPDPTGKSKLTTLAQELGMILLPEAFMPLDFAAGHVPNVRAALQRGGLPAAFAMLPMELKGPEQQGTLWFAWPAMEADAVLSAPTATKTEEKTVAASTAPTSKGAKPTEPSEAEFDAALENMPPYVRSLLKIEVPVSVTLASTRQPVERVLNLGPGSIIQFEQSCEQPLVLSVGNRQVAEGEAVKVGDKFGIRITAMTLPGERFFPLAGKRGIRKAS